MYKILMIAPTPFFSDRGCHVQIYEQARALAKKGNKVTVCTYHNGRNIEHLNIKRTINIPWYTKTSAGPSWHKLYLDILLFIRALAVALFDRPDVIHGHLHEGALIGYVIKKLTRIPLLFDLQGSLTGELKSHDFIRQGGFLDNVFYRMESFIDNCADITVTQSSDMLRELEVKFGVKNTYLTFDGVDSEMFKPLQKDERLKKKLGIPEGRTIVTYLGILSEYQGIDCLMKAIPLTVRQCPSAHFLIMGYPNVEKYKIMAATIGMRNQITFTGRIDYNDAPNYLSLADIAVGPKCGETEADGKIYNYMACGLPVAASDTEVHREILGDTAVYAEVQDAEALADAMSALLKDEEKRKTMGGAARKRVVEKFSWDSVADRLEKCYETISSHNRA